MRPPMRSSIACLRCRKSKIKCDNDNTGAACDTCIKSGHKCEFPDPVPLPPKRPEPPTNLKQEKEAGHERKRAKKLDDVTLFDSQRSTAYAEEVLSAQYLTGELWDQVFGIYKLHFATELPFLHLPTLKEKMTRQLKDQNKMSPEVNLVLLGILALTARFHTDLVKYVAHMSYDKVGGPRSRGAHPRPDPAAASEFFANALTTALGPLKTSMTVATVERVQAFLMLGLYEWSQARQHGGLGAWMYVGVAIRMAQALKLGFGDKPGRGSQAPFPASAGKPAQTPSEMGITREIKRRTMFSCLILDRMLACGKERVSTIRSEDLQIQLPCTEMAFDLALDVNTGFLSAADDKKDVRAINDDSVLSRFVQLVDIWGEISKFSFSGGRLAEKEPPWYPDTAFRRLRERLDDFYASLPETFTLSTSNYYRHDNHQATSMFVSLHMLGSVCQIMLHREYIPFIPIRCQKPEGPLDDPVFSPDIVPHGFWEASAEQVFKAARDIVELIEMCREKLPHSSLVLFAIWTAAFVGIYARHFPHMDTENHMVSQEEIQERNSKADVDITLTGSTSVTFHTLNRMAQYFSMASSYVTYFKEMDKYFTKVFIDYHRHVGKNRFLAGQSGDGKLSIRLGGDGGGLEEWRMKGDKITNNGTILDDDRHQHYEGSDRSRGSTLERCSSNGPENSLTNNSMSDMAKTPRSTPSFTAINNRGLPSGSLHDAGPDPRQDGLHGVGGKYQYLSQHQHSPTQSYSMASGPPLTEVDMDRVSDFNIEQYMNNHQYLRFGSVLNDVQEFAGGSSVLHPAMFDGFPEDVNRSSFFGQAADGILLPQFAGYEV